MLLYNADISVEERNRERTLSGRYKADAGATTSYKVVLRPDRGKDIMLSDRGDTVEEAITMVMEGNTDLDGVILWNSKRYEIRSRDYISELHMTKYTAVLESPRHRS